MCVCVCVCVCVIVKCLFFLPVTLEPKPGLVCLFWRLLNLMQLDARARLESCERVNSSSQGPLRTLLTRHQATDLHPLSGIGTRSPRTQAAANLCRRPYGYRDRRFVNCSSNFCYISLKVFDFIEWNSV